jgi:prepilin peptidase CpaA
MTPLATPLAALLATLAVVAAGWDIATRRIPNPLIAAAFVCGVLLQLWLYGFPGIKAAALGFAVGFTVFFPLFLLHGKGGGDVKLMAAIGTITGPANCFVIFLLTAIFGGVMAIVLLLVRGGLLRALRNVFRILGSLARLRAPYTENPELSIDHPQSVKLPYAIPIALGCLVFLLLSRIHERNC